jgi:hypothetical protein
MPKPGTSNTSSTRNNMSPCIQRPRRLLKQHADLWMLDIMFTASEWGRFLIR